MDVVRQACSPFLCFYVRLNQTATEHKTVTAKETATTVVMICSNLQDWQMCVFVILLWNRAVQGGDPATKCKKFSTKISFLFYRSLFPSYIVFVYWCLLKNF